MLQIRVYLLFIISFFLTHTATFDDGTLMQCMLRIYHKDLVRVCQIVVKMAWYT